jgi:N-acetylglucosaminyl-diphospho-decaprenol L-rhamnosyltransferase
VNELDSLAAVIVNWNTPDYTIRSAWALIDDGIPPERVVVVDNGSADDSFSRFGEALERCVLVRIEENIGFGRASNRGAHELPGAHYLFVNNDAFVHEQGSVRRLAACLEQEDVGIAVPRLLNPDLTLQPSVAPTHSPGVALVRASGLSRFIPNRWQPSWSTHWDHGSSREIQAVVGAVLLVRGEAWEQLGGFDERIYMYAEDLDLCWRAGRLGWKVWFCAESEFVHIGNISGRQAWANPRRGELVGRSEAGMIRRNLSPGAARVTLGLISAGIAARWLVQKALRNDEAAASLHGSLRGFRSRSEG